MVGVRGSILLSASPLARWVLTIAASQAKSEGQFSSPGCIVTKTRNSISADNVDLMAYLRNFWAAVKVMMKSRGTAQPPIMIS